MTTASLTTALSCLRSEVASRKAEGRSDRQLLDAYAAATSKALSGVYDNYRFISSSHVTIAGFPAVEQRSRGAAA